MSRSAKPFKETLAVHEGRRTAMPPIFQMDVIAD